MKLKLENWFDKLNRNTKGYSQIEERLYYLKNSDLTDNERIYEVSVIEKLVSMVPNGLSRITYSNKLKKYIGGEQ